MSFERIITAYVLLHFVSSPCLIERIEGGLWVIILLILKPSDFLLLKIWHRLIKMRDSQFIPIDSLYLARLEPNMIKRDTLVACFQAS